MTHKKTELRRQPLVASEKEQSPGSREYSLAKDILYENKIFQWWITHEKGWHYGWVLSANVFLAFFVFSYKVFVEEGDGAQIEVIIVTHSL